jgi:tape measure domain-containing protein
MEGGDFLMSTIEERVVQMKFDTKEWSSNVQPVLDQLKALKEGLKLEGAQKGLEEVNASANRFSLDGMKNHLTEVKARFTALEVAAVTALSNIVNRAVNAGLQLAKSLTIQPLISGFREYETNLNSIQTILANTGLKGAEGLNTVTDALEELNHYSDQTIYNFSEMAKNIGTFTAAGVKLEVATSAIKGIANLAAISGSNAEQASAAMYQLSQALAAGKVTLEDWNSVVNAGMGGKVFQDALIETARVHGVNIDEIIKKQGSFRLSLEKGWLTSGILTETLSKFTGELSAEQLKSMGYTDEQAKGILEMGQTAVDAATKVKTVTQLMTTLREGLGSGWAKTWQIIFGDFDEAKGTFTGVSNVLGGMIQNASDARNELLKTWKELGGRTALLDGIGNAFQALLSILRPIRDAFQQMFPAATAQQLYEMTVNFRNFTERLKIGEDTANNLRRTFAGFFAILGIGWDLLKAGIAFIGELIGKLTQGSGGFLKFTGSVGDFLVALRSAIQEGQGFTKFFSGLSAVLSIPIKLIISLASWLGKLFDKFDTGTAEQSVNSLTNSFKPLGTLGEKVSAIWSKIVQFFSSMSNVLGNAGRWILDWGRGVIDSLESILGDLDFGHLLGGINTGLFAALLAMLYNFISDFKPGTFLEGLTDSLDAFTGSLKGMQHALNAVALLTIAAAIGILTLSLVALSKIDSAGLTRASVAITVMMGQLAAAFVLFNKISTGGSAVKVAAMSVGLILLATAVRVLASSVEKLSSIPTDQLARGLFGVAALLAILVAATNRLDTNTSGIIRTAASMIILGVALRVLVFSVRALGELDMEILGKGLVGVGALLASLVLFTKFAQADKGGLSQGIGLILLATALKILASAVGDFAQYSWEELGRGMAAIAVGLGLITAAMRFLPEGAVIKAAGFAIIAFALKMIADGVSEMSKLSWIEIARGMTVMAGALGAIALAIGFLPPHSLLSAAAILVVAVALGMIQEALGKMSGMTWEEIGKGLTVLAASLLLIGAAIYVLQGAIGGAAAILVVAVALNILVPVLQALGEMSWEAIVKGLVGLAGVFVILGLAGYFLGPLAPAITALAGSIALLGLAVLAAGIGVLAFATGLGILAAVGVGATAAIVGIVTGLVGLIPYVMEQIGLGLVAFAKVIATSGPAILDAITTVLNSLLDSIIEVTPKIVDTLKLLLDKMLQLLIDSVPKMVDAGGKILTGVLQGIANNIGGIVDAAVSVIVNFLDGIGRNLPRVIQAGVDLILNYVNGLADGIRNNAEKVGEAGWNLASALVEGVIKGIGAMVSKAVDAAVALARDMFNAAKKALGIASPSKEGIWLMKQFVLGNVVGIKKNSYLAENAAEDFGENIIDTMGKTLSGLSKVLGSDLIDFNPTITPVLDLSDIRKDAEDLARLMGMAPLDVSNSYRKAQIAGTDYEKSRSQGDESDLSPGGDSYTYNQYNTSPKALPAAEIYRQTNNLISRTRAKEDSNA